jgi:hypothetical protein
VECYEKYHYKQIGGLNSLGVITTAKQNPVSGGFRLARIQYTSSLRNQNLYFSHRYNIKVSKQHLYSSANLVDSYCKLFCSTNGVVAEVSDNSFYIYDSGTYIDICINLSDTFSRVVAEVDTIEIGSVSLKADAYSLTGLTRLLIPNPTVNSMFNKLYGKIYSYYQDFSTTTTVKLNNVDTFQIAIGGDVAVIAGNSIAKTPTSWTLTKGTDIVVATETIGSNYTITTPSNYRGTVVFY